MGYYVADKYLENLKKYKYSGVDKSILSKYVLNPFWTWFVTLWPTWVAPNTITFLGLCLVLTNLATMIYYDPQYLTEKGGATGPPNWVYYSWAAGLFWYQAFDAIDGKQARRTGMAGPLGQMFDHGCDAMNTTFEVILAARAFNLGRSWWTVVSQVAAVSNFYLTTWEEFHTGTLYLGVFSGPVDGIIIICIMYAITGYYGPSLWDTKFVEAVSAENLLATHAPKLLVQLNDLAISDVFYVIGMIQVFFNVALSYRNVYRARVAINKSPITPLGRFLPFLVTCFLNIAWLSGSGPLSGAPGQSYVLYSNCFLPFLGFWAFEFAHQVGKMILAHVTHQRFPYWDWSWVFTSVLAMDANAERLFGRQPILHQTTTTSGIVVALALLTSFVAYVRFCTLVIQDITEYLGIACFSVRKRDPATGEWITAQQLEAKKLL
ncbi:hypothetical protein FRB94_010715 [Tulasnella sp. JGI-2019a]|nr:hypothetical protein FRB93_006221 [Tulasnella sp. JGI-2019a]KAG8993537.1 hypothetical protein FRB94_010715 [Tulasnella sp. JGI-2019a]